MAIRPVNLFPKDLRETIVEIAAPHAHHLVLMKISPSTAGANGSPYCPSPEKVLHLEELAIFSGYTLSKRRSEFLAGRFCAKIAIIDYLCETCPEKPDVSMNQIEICAGTGGRPGIVLHNLPTAPVLELSIAHSNKYAAAVAAKAVCGIDLQQSSSTLARVQSRFCTHEELLLLTGALPRADQLEKLTLLWAVKEAAKKALSYWKMPGFLDLETVHISRKNQSCSSLTMAVKNTASPMLPSEITVVASLFCNYGLAVSIIDKDSINA